MRGAKGGQGRDVQAQGIARFKIALVRIDVQMKVAKLTRSQNRFIVLNNE